MTAPATDPRFSRTTLDSGVTVVTERMDSVRSVSVGFWFDVGARDEPDVMAGTSHFIEHLLFKGTPARSAKDIADTFDAVGGDINAFTGKEFTCYYARILDEDLPMAMDVLSDMLVNSKIDPGEFESERRVILEEIAMHEDAPDELVHDLFFRAMWDGHPLGRPVLGYNQTISGVAREHVVDYWRERYLPPNMVVAAAGNLDHDALVEAVQERFSPREGTRTLRSGTGPDSRTGVSVHRRPTEQAHIAIGTNGYSRKDPLRFPFGVVNSVLGGGMSSRLFQEIREKRGLAYSVYSYHSMYAEAGLFCAYAGTTPGRAREVLSIVRGQLEDVAEKGLTPDEFERAKGHMRGSLVLSLEDPGGRMSRLGKSEISHGETLTVNQLLARISSVTPEDARRAAERVLSQPMTTTVLGPFGARALA